MKQKVVLKRPAGKEACPHGRQLALCLESFAYPVQLWPEAHYTFELPQPICNSTFVLLHSVWFPFSFLVNVPFEKFQLCLLELGGKGIVQHAILNMQEGGVRGEE